MKRKYIRPNIKIHQLSMRNAVNATGLETRSNEISPDDEARKSNPWPTGEGTSTGTGSDTGGNGAWTEW